MGSLLLLITTMCAATSGYTTDCNDELVDLSPCLNYLTDASDYPSLDCCEQLPVVSRSEPSCFCPVIDGEVSELLGVPIDTERAISLPSACDDDHRSKSARSRPASPNTTIASGDDLGSAHKEPAASEAPSVP